MQEFFQVLQYLIATNSKNIIAGDLNYVMSRWLINQHICLDL